MESMVVALFKLEHAIVIPFTEEQLAVSHAHHMMVHFAAPGARVSPQRTAASAFALLDTEVILAKSLHV